MHDVSRIVALRRWRLDRMLRAENAEKAAVAEAGAACETAQKAIDTYLEETRTLEIDLLTGLLNKQVSVNDLLAIEETLRQTRERAQALANRRADCKTRLAEAEARARMARQNRAQNALKLNRSELVRDHVQRLRAQAAMRSDEAAMDAFCEQMAARRCGDGGHEA